MSKSANLKARTGNVKSVSDNGVYAGDCVKGGGLLTIMDAQERAGKAHVLHDDGSTVRIAIPEPGFFSFGDRVSFVLDEKTRVVGVRNHETNEVWQYATPSPSIERHWTVFYIGFKIFAWTIVLTLLIAMISLGNGFWGNLVWLNVGFFLVAALWSMTLLPRNLKTRRHAIMSALKTAAERETEAA